MSGKRKSGAPSDFKRIKAKVGKKALKPANVTDTSFRAASVSVRSQTVDFSATSSDKLVSARGRSVHELTTQLHHPAAAVRTSAIRGLGSIVVATDTEFLKAHLSNLLPAVAKCCVDEDESVRQLGLTVLRDVLTRTANECGPFLPLLTAYVTSALNSLDRATRLDGSRAVEILSTVLPSLMDVEVILPAFSGLLSDHSQQHSRRSADVPNKRKKTGSEAERYTILQSLVSLLRAIPDKQDSMRDASGTMADAKPDLTFVSGGRTVNALHIVRHRERSVRPIKNMDELVGFTETHQLSSQGKRSEHEGLSVAVATDLITKLRNILVEITQRGNHEGSRRGLFLGAVDVEELSLLMASIDLFWNSFCQDMLRQSGDAAHELRQVFTSLLSLILESFPVYPQNPSKELAPKYNVLNADICATLMDVGGHLAPESKGVGDWTKRVLDYLLPRLENDTLASTEEENPLTGPSSTVVDIVARLLLLKHFASEFTLTEKTRQMVMKKVCAVFFSDKDMNADMMRSAASRSAALLVMAVLSHENFLFGDNNSPFATSLTMAVKILPYYLKAWSDDYLSTSKAVISALHNIARRLDMESSSTQDILASLREGLVVVFAAPKRIKGKKLPLTSAAPIFEQYPEEMQRLVLGLLVMLRSSTDEITNGLGYMCVRCGNATSAVSPAIADAALYSMHSIRRSMPMQAYLSFVIRSIGIVNALPKRKKKDIPDKNGGATTGSSVETKNPEELVDNDSSPVQEIRLSDTPVDLQSVKASEASVIRATRFLVLCGSEKVLPMITPVLKEWLEAICPNSGFNVTEKMIRFRAASAIIAMMSLDIQSSSMDIGGEFVTPTSIFDFTPELAGDAATAVCNAFLLCSTRSRAEKDSLDVFDYILQPMLVS